MMSALKNMDEFCNDFKGKSMLQGWDMMVAYRLKEVNEMLAARHKDLLSKDATWNMLNISIDHTGT